MGDTRPGFLRSLTCRLAGGALLGGASWEDQEVQSLSDTLRLWEEKYPEVRVLEDVVLLPPERALLLASERARLLVVGRRGQRLGPATTGLLAGTRAAVAVVPE
ncbi:hypothetical protein [Streptomyces sp. BH105]|uniref:hypothetical protein n=1 Tax=Streptomyces sp. BH105 TaxID=3410408 RepID=UPI003CF847B3